MLVWPTGTGTRYLHVVRRLSPSLAYLQRVLFSINTLRLDGTRHENAIIMLHTEKT